MSQFLAIPSSGDSHLVFSADGSTWTQAELPALGAGQIWNACAFGGGRYVAVASNGSDVAAWSDDGGLTWHEARLPIASNWQSIAWNGSVFCAAGGFDADTVATSPDGEVWTQGAIAPGFWAAIVWNGAFFCALNGAFPGGAGGEAALSADGLAWTYHSISGTTSKQWFGLAWNGTVFCAVATDGTEEVATSPDGVTWTIHVISSDSSLGFDGIAWNGTVFCTVSLTATVASATSTDGEAWEIHPMPGPGSYVAVAWNGTLFCAVSSNLTDQVATSPDGATWTLQTLPVADNWVSVTAGDAAVVAPPPPPPPPDDPTPGSDTMGALVHARDVVGDTTALLLQQYRDATAPGVREEVGAYAAEGQVLEDALWSILDNTAIDSPSTLGVNLDRIGKIVGQPRGGLDDATYLLWIKARVRLNRSSGSINDILAIFLALNPGASLKIVNEYPAAFSLNVNGIVVALPSEQAKILGLAPKAGVRGVLVYSTAPAGSGFTFEGGSGKGFPDAALTPGSGGKLAGAAE